MRTCCILTPRSLDPEAMKSCLQKLRSFRYQMRNSLGGDNLDTPEEMAQKGIGHNRDLRLGIGYGHRRNGAEPTALTRWVMLSTEWGGGTGGGGALKTLIVCHSFPRRSRMQMCFLQLEDRELGRAANLSVGGAGVGAGWDFFCFLFCFASL